MKKKTFALGAALLSLSALTLGGIAGELSNTYAIDARAEGDDSSETVTDGPHTGVDMFVSADGDLSYSGETSSIIGQIYYWDLYNNGTNTTATYTNEDSTLTVTYFGSYNWYGVQLFYYAPYNTVVSNITDWAVTATITSTFDGPITVNGNVITLSSSQDVSLSVSPQSGHATLDIQFGEDTGGNGTYQASGTVTFKNLQIIDPTNEYYRLTFLDNQENVIDNVYTLSGYTPWTVPTATEVEGSTFLYWKDANGTTYTANDIAALTPTADMTFTAVYQTSDATVTYHIGETAIETVDAAKGGYLTAPSYGYDKCGFGYGVAGWYTDDTLTTEWDFSSNTVDADYTDLYAKLWIENSATWDTYTNTISDEYFSHDSDGNLIYAGDYGYGTDESFGYYKQVNFEEIPEGTSGVNYSLSFDYKANCTPTVKVYGDDTYDSLILDETDDWTTVTLSFPGGGLGTGNKLTFEFGAIPNTTQIDFRIGKIAITEQSYDIAAFVPADVGAGELAYVKVSTSETYIQVDRVETEGQTVQINYGGTEYYIYVGEIVPSEYGITTGTPYAVYFSIDGYSTYGAGLTINNYSSYSWNDLIFAVPAEDTGAYASVDGEVDDINAAVDYLSGTLYGSNWRDTYGSICWLTTNTSALNQLLTDYDALDDAVREWADRFVDYGDSNKCTYGETIAYLANFDVDTSSETLSIFGDSDSATTIAMIVLISAAAILGLGGVLIYKRRHNAA